MSKEIKAQIDELRWQLEEATVPGMFTLNPEVVRINKEIETLQNKCNHHYVEGQCEFCYHLEEN
jgi:hypothetical protein